MLAHPFLVHARSKNLGKCGVGSVRFMCHPAVPLKERMCVQRADNAKDLSPVEAAIADARPTGIGGVTGGLVEETEEEIPMSTMGFQGIKSQKK